MSNRFVSHSRRRFLSVIGLLLVIILLPVYVSSVPQGARKPTVILISLDGFRWDYLDRAPLPAMKELIARGVKAKGLIPVFPSETFPNHYSIVTGTYPEVNGMVKNSFYDPALKASFSMRGEPATQGKWWGAEPIWVTTEKQGQIAATYFWPGSEAEINGKRPTYWKHYDGKIPDSDRVKEVLSWLDLPDDKRPTFISLYISDMDSVGHNFGPDSPEIVKALPGVDDAIGQLTAGLKERKLQDQVNIIIVSDHGMAASDRKQTIYLEDYVDLNKLETDRQFTGTNAHIWPVAGKEDEVYQALTRAPHITFYRKEKVPAYFHYKNNARIAPIVGVLEEGWTLSLKRDPQNTGKQREGIGGNHGYDPKLTSMHGIFIAAGPAFKQGMVVEPFENIQIYNVMAAILKLKPSPNDGNLASVKGMLK